jgi:hypothetical protein
MNMSECESARECEESSVVVGGGGGGVEVWQSKKVG